MTGSITRRDLFTLASAGAIACAISGPSAPILPEEPFHAVGDMYFGRFQPGTSVTLPAEVLAGWPVADREGSFTESVFISGSLTTDDLKRGKRLLLSMNSKAPKGYAWFDEATEITRAAFEAALARSARQGEAEVGG